MSKDTSVHLELIDQRNEDQRWRDEAAVKLAVKPGQREALERARLKLLTPQNYVGDAERLARNI